MISLDAFETLVRDQLERDLSENPAQREAISHSDDRILTVVAGPGSGKTTVIILRALRHVFVDDILPDNIVITTFTIKAAKELRTRWLDWGNSLYDALFQNEEYREQMRGIDLNRCRISTLDSLTEQTLSEYRAPGEVAPILLEESAARLIFKRASFSPGYTANKASLDGLLGKYTFDGQPPRTRGQALEVAKIVCDRLVQDQVQLAPFAANGVGEAAIVDILTLYQQFLTERNMFDFANLEQQLLNRLRDGALNDWKNEIQALLIDEYQDTNPLQEAIYHQILVDSEKLVTVVGDDDQAMYRFRGGSVELFTQFAVRCHGATGYDSHRVDMITNYRSSAEIVDFYNQHITGDPGFNAARILPAKPLVTADRGSLEMPILGMFREDATTLADSLATLLAELIHNRRLDVPGNANAEITLRDDGDLGDLVLLSHSVEEVTYNRFNGNPDVRFAGYLRDALVNHGLPIFNPRGRSLRTIESVQRLLGLLLLCLDPDDELVGQVYPTNEARYFLNLWRAIAGQFVADNPYPSMNGGLPGFIDRWTQASRGVHIAEFPPDWPVLELIFKLVTWIQGFQNDPEHQVWLEAVTRTVASSSIGSPYGMQLMQSDAHRIRSRESFIRDALLPIAANEVAVDEDIMPSVPRNRLQVMTIHQAKGLEFPMVIVDVGSRFRTKHAAQAFLRFPAAPSNVVVMEDDVEPFLPSPLRAGRAPLDRSFDDLARLSYVAFSRPQSVLLLVGLEPCLSYGRGANLASGVIPNVALGWTRGSAWPWRQAYHGNVPPVRVEPSFLQLI
jgi:DNA helicase II / ATP-dependent DNA helicase PcrA